MPLSNLQKKILQQSYSTILSINKLSNLGNLELLMVLMDDKPAMADAIFFDSQLKVNIKQVQTLGKQIGLHLATSKYKYIINSPQGIFEEIPRSDNRAGSIILAFAKSQNKAQRGADYYHAKMVDGNYGYKFGKLMGYPECCLQFGNYLNNLEGDPNNFGFKNPAVESLKRSKHFAWQLNIFAVSLLSHFPCHLACRKSIVYVNKILKYLDYIHKDSSAFFKNRLQEPATLYWTCVDRVLLYGDFKRYTLSTGEIQYHKVESIITSDAFYQKVDKEKINQWRNIEQALQKGNKLKVAEHLCSIYFNKEKIFEAGKDNKYKPVLVKPDPSP